MSSESAVSTPAAAVSAAPDWLGPLVRAMEDVTDLLRARAWPLLDLAIRFWLGQTFLVSGLIKVANWENAVLLATYEYPVSWLAPEYAAVLGVLIEVLGGAMLIVGLGTRFAAIPMAILSLVIQYAYIEVPAHLFWAQLFGWYALAGAGPISLDRLLGRGVMRLPLPLALTIGKAAIWSNCHLAPLYMLMFRLSIAWIFFASGLTKIADFENAVLLFEYEYAVPLLPPLVAAVLATAVELISPVLLVAGFCTRLATLPLIVTTLVIQFTYLDHVDHFHWLIVLGMIALRGPGPLSLDFVLGRQVRRRHRHLFEPARWDDLGKPHVVVVGAGFGGVAAVRGLRHSPCRVTLIDRRNYHLFQPLLYQVATAGLSPADIAAPIRELFREQTNVRVVMGRVTGVDTAEKAVLVGHRRIPYNRLVLATGARHAYFGKDEWERFAPGLKKIADATAIRGRILTAFEQAEAADYDTDRRAWLTFVIIGGGPTGVELAGAIAELAHTGMSGEFRHALPEDARVVLVQSAERLLPPFPEALSARTKEELERLGVDVRLNCRVTGVDETGVYIGEHYIAARTVLWAAGVMASPAAKWLGAAHDRAGRVAVGDDLSVPGLPEVFVIGDTAASNAWNGEPVPGLAPAAKQGGAYVAEVLHRQLTGRAAPGPFRYRHAGNLATIGRAAAVADLGRIRVAGPLAWWFWGLVHVMFLGTMRNRVSVALEWIWAYLTFRRSTRLITEEAAAAE